MSSRRIIQLLTAFSCVFTTNAFAANNPEIKWKTTESAHFIIYYYDDVEWTARKVAKVAEEIYPKVTGLYGHEPKQKTRLIVRDDEDTSNGFAVFNLGFITIWASPWSMPLRGRHDWIRGVLTHEFAHVISLQVASGGGQLIEGFYLGGIQNGDTKANTDIGGTLFVPTNPYARWWAEGTAELDTSIVGYDLWDHNQEMLLRAATLEGNLLTFDQQRNITVREHFGGEMVYNQGYAFLLWLRNRFGADVNIRIAKTSGDAWNLEFDKNLKKVTGLEPKELDRFWRQALTEKYSKQAQAIGPLMEGEPIALITEKKRNQISPEDRPYADGVFNYFPRFSPDGHWYSWVSRSTVKLRYLDEPFHITLPSEDKDELKPLPLTLDFPGSYYSWSPDSSRIVISRRKANVFGGFPYHDLFMVDLSELSKVRANYLTEYQAATSEKAKKSQTRFYGRKSKKVDPEPKRISKGLRATHPAWSPDGQWIAFAANRDGHRNLRMVRPDGTGLNDLVALNGDSESTEPTWSPDGKTIIFTLFHHEQADLWSLDVQSGAYKPLTMDAADDREAIFAPDGKSILFSSDRSGIFQLYRMDLEGEKNSAPKPLTNVVSGAFMPAISPDGKSILYSRFSSFGFKPYQMAGENAALPSPSESSAPLAGKSETEQRTPEEFPAIQGKPYGLSLRPVRLFPTLVYEGSQVKGGIALQVSDYLEKHELSAWGLFGRDQDYRVAYTNNMWYPSFTAAYTGYIRNSSFVFANDGDALSDEPKGAIQDQIQFLDAGVTLPLLGSKALEGRHTLSLFYDRRIVDRRAGFPTFIGNSVDTKFRLITNDTAAFDWTYDAKPSRLPRDFDANPQDWTHASFGYSLIRTSLPFADTSISTPNQVYRHHEFMLSFYRYFSSPWSRPWWEYHTPWLRFVGGAKTRNVSSLDEFFMGGRLNYRSFGQIQSNTLFYGYEDFSISGETMLLLTLGYTLPIARAIDQKWNFFYWDGLYATFFGEVGNAWNYGEYKNLSQGATGTILLEDIGAELKLKAFAFNDSNRWNSILRVAYGFQDNAAHGFANNDNPIRIYIGIGSEF